MSASPAAPTTSTFSSGDGVNATLKALARCIVLAAAVTGLAAATHAAGHPVLLVPLALTCVLALAVPRSPLARAGAVAGGYGLALMTAAAVPALHLPMYYTLGVAAGASLAAATLARAVHPPAIALAILLVRDGPTPGIFVTAAVAVMATATLLDPVNRVLPPAEHLMSWAPSQSPARPQR